MSRGEGQATLRCVVAALAAFALLGTACGARLTDEQRNAAIAAARGQGGGSGAGGVDGDLFDDFDLDDPDVFVDSEGRVQRRPGTAGTAGQAQGGGGGGPTGPGRLEATDVGVTPTDITITTIANIRGVQPGLFQSAHDAMQAWTAYVNSQGGIHGRQVRTQLVDDQTESGGNRQRVLEACDRSFALVGSMSAFDDGGAAAGAECGIPDLSAIVVTAPRMEAPNVYAAFPNRSQYLGMGTAEWIKRNHPQVVNHAAGLWLNAPATRGNMQRRIEAYRAVGFDWVYEAQVELVEPNYARFVRAMRDEGARYVSMVASKENLVQLQNAMRQQNWYPDVRDWDSVAYDPGYIELGRDAVEGSYVYINSAMLEEASQIPEMQEYFRWLQRVRPGADPTYFGIYAWSAGRLFQHVATEVGPNLTRERLFEALRGVRTWDGHGLHVPHETSRRMPSACYIYLQVRNGRFQRMYPDQGFSCENAHTYELQGDYE